MKKLIILAMGLFLVSCATTNISQIRDKWGPPSYTLDSNQGSIMIYDFPAKGKAAYFFTDSTGNIRQKGWYPRYLIDFVATLKALKTKQQQFAKMNLEFEKTLTEDQKQSIKENAIFKKDFAPDFFTKEQINILYEAKNLKESMDKDTEKINSIVKMDNERAKQIRQDQITLLSAWLSAPRVNVYQQQNWIPMYQYGRWHY